MKKIFFLLTVGLTTISFYSFSQTIENNTSEGAVLQANTGNYIGHTVQLDGDNGIIENSIITLSPGEEVIIKLPTGDQIHTVLESFSLRFTHTKRIELTEVIK